MEDLETTSYAAEIYHFECSHKGNQCTLTLNLADQCFSWRAQASCAIVDTGSKYRLDEILLARQASKSDGGSSSSGGGCVSSNCLELVAGVRVRDSSNRWRLQQVSFSGLADCASLLAVLTPALEAAAASAGQRRPRSLLVLVNPTSGNGGAVRVSDRLLRPALQQCGVAARFVHTERRHHAKEFILSEKLEPFDGIIGVGGDGILSEIFHGVLLRKRQDRGLVGHSIDEPELPPDHVLGIVPAGSTDTVAHTLNGTSDAMTSIVQILLGRRVAMDAMSVYSESGQFLTYNISLLGYGYFGEVIRSSEPLRWMGPARYDLVGAHRLLNLRSHSMEITFVESEARSHAVCTRNCPVCASASSSSSSSSAPLLIENGRPAQQPPQPQRTITGRFVAVNSFLMPCRSTKSVAGAVPFAHLGDGCADLVLVRSCSKAEFLRHLYRVSSCPVGLSASAAPAAPDAAAPAAAIEPQFQLDCVEVHRVRQFRVRLLDEPPTSVWNCDGEVLRQGGLSVRVHRQLLQMFGCHVSL